MIETNAIVLKTQPFDESGKIISLFTKNLGIQSAIIKSINPTRLDLVQATTPLYEGCYHLKKGRSDLYKIIEVSSINYYHLIKQDFTRLTCATLILKLIIDTQIKNKPIPLLYLLTSKYLHELETSSKPKIILLSFYLKFLRHEGLFDLQSFCEGSNELITPVTILCFSLKFDELYEVELKDQDFEKIQNRFMQIIEQEI